MGAHPGRGPPSAFFCRVSRGRRCSGRGRSLAARHWVRAGRGAIHRFGYDTDGQRSLKITPTTVTAYFGATELTVPTTGTNAGTITGTRTYTHAGSAVAVRTGNTAFTYLFADIQGSATLAVGSGTPTTATVNRQRYTPYGATRGPANQLPTDHGWLGQTEDDTTGLTYLNARYYDPLLARFLSPDPLLTAGAPITHNPYTYALGNPLTYSDPSGLRCTPDDGPNCTDGGRGASGTRDKDDPKYVKTPNTSPGTVVAAPAMTWLDELNCNYVVCGPPHITPSPDYSTGWSSGTTHMILQVGGLIPVLGDWLDPVDAAVYEYEGDHKQAAISVSAGIPFLGIGSTFARWGTKASKVAREAPAPNALVRDLKGFEKGNDAEPLKSGLARSRSDQDLLDSVFVPDDGIHIQTYTGGGVELMEGNHRRFELMRRATDPGSSITWDTPIFIKRN